MLHAARVIRGRRVHGSILVLSWSVSRVLELTQTHFHMHTDSHDVYSCASCSLRGFQAVPVRHRGEPGHTRDTHGTHTGHAGAQRHTDHADEPHNHPNPPTTHIPHVSGRQRDDRSRGRLNSHRPGADRSPRPAQYRRIQYTSGMLVRFVCVIRVPVCARVSRVFPG
jgi:hypothetical protein